MLRYGLMMLPLLRARFQKEEGQGMVEYGLIIALIAVVLVGVLVSMRGGLEATFQNISDCLGDPSACGSGS